MGIRDFIRHLEEHRERLKKGPSELSDAEREETLREAETMVGMADAAIRELESVIGNRRINLPEEHAVRFAQDVFLYLREEEEKVKERLREITPATRPTPSGRRAARSRRRRLRPPPPEGTT